MSCIVYSMPLVIDKMLFAEEVELLWERNVDWKHVWVAGLNFSGAGHNNFEWISVVKRGCSCSGRKLA